MCVRTGPAGDDDTVLAVVTHHYSRHNRHVLGFHRVIDTRQTHDLGFLAVDPDAQLYRPRAQAMRQQQLRRHDAPHHDGDNAQRDAHADARHVNATENIDDSHDKRPPHRTDARPTCIRRRTSPCTAYPRMRRHRKSARNQHRQRSRDEPPTCSETTRTQRSRTSVVGAANYATTRLRGGEAGTDIAWATTW